MSPSYKRMTLHIEGVSQQRLEAVKKAANEHWPFQLWNRYGSNIFASGEGFLDPHESKEEFADRLSWTVWDANEGYCAIEIQEAYVEIHPHHTYRRGRRDYERLWGLHFPITNHLRRIMESIVSPASDSISHGYGSKDAAEKTKRAAKA